MTFFKILRGNKANLPEEKHDGYVYFCTDTKDFYIDYIDANSEIQRTKISSDNAEKLRYVKDGTIVEVTPETLIENKNWLENDSTKSTYIKNRTHYKEVNDAGETVYHKLDNEYLNLDNEIVEESSNPVTSGAVANKVKNLVEKELIKTANIDTSISKDSLNDHVPSSKCVFDALEFLNTPNPLYYCTTAASNNYKEVSYLSPSMVGTDFILTDNTIIDVLFNTNHFCKQTKGVEGYFLGESFYANTNTDGVRATQLVQDSSGYYSDYGDPAFYARVSTSSKVDSFSLDGRCILCLDPTSNYDGTRNWPFIEYTDGLFSSYGITREKVTTMTRGYYKDRVFYTISRNGSEVSSPKIDSVGKNSGYYKNGKFYSDDIFETEMTILSGCYCADLSTNTIYYFNGSTYEACELNAVEPVEGSCYMDLFATGFGAVVYTCREEDSYLDYYETAAYLTSPPEGTLLLDPTTGYVHIYRDSSWETCATKIAAPINGHGYVDISTNILYYYVNNSYAPIAETVTSPETGQYYKDISNRKIYQYTGTVYNEVSSLYSVFLNVCNSGDKPIAFSQWDKPAYWTENEIIKFRYSKDSDCWYLISHSGSGAPWYFDVTYEEGEEAAHSQYSLTGSRVDIFYQGPAKTHSGSNLLFTIPEEFCPSDQIFAPFVKNNNAYGLILITPDGRVLVSQISNTTANGRVYFQASYYI